MKKVTLILLVLFAAALVLAACGGDDGEREDPVKDLMKALDE
ncbi:MAG: EfeM/EfeO family lipoprotein, partial [Chloroflexi bacterium]|nr:EfeM/EfeO family lipoprotein [Chloroflexota bacterium]